MADYRIFPTENDVGNATGEGAWATEPNLIRSLGSATGTDFGISQILSGFTQSGTGTGTLTIATGTAIVEGHHVELVNSQQFDISSASGNAHYYWLSLLKNSGLVTGATILSLTSTTQQPDAVFLVGITLTGTAPNKTILSIADGRLQSPSMREFGEYSGDGTNDRNISLPFKPSYVEVRTQGVVARSGIPLIPFSAGQAGEIDSDGGGGSPSMSVNLQQWHTTIGTPSASSRYEIPEYFISVQSVDFNDVSFNSVPADGSEELTFALSTNPPNDDFRMCLLQIANVRVDMSWGTGHLWSPDSGTTWNCTFTAYNHDGSPHKLTAGAETVRVFVVTGGRYDLTENKTFNGALANNQYVPAIANNDTKFQVSFDKTLAADPISLNRSGVTYRYFAIG